MEQINHLLEPLAAYPRWFVIACLVLVAVGGVWLLAKLVKWALLLALGIGLLLLILVAVAWLLG